MKVLYVGSNGGFESKRSLSKNDYEFVTENSTKRALNKVKQEMPDLILLQKNRRSNGIARFKKHYPGIPLLIVSDEKEIESKITCLEQGADSYLSYPFKPKELVAQMKALIRSFEWQRMRTNTA